MVGGTHVGALGQRPRFLDPLEPVASQHRHLHAEGTRAAQDRLRIGTVARHEEELGPLQLGQPLELGAHLGRGAEIGLHAHQLAAPVLQVRGECLTDPAAVVIVEIEHAALLELQPVRHPACERGTMREVAGAHAEGVGLQPLTSGADDDGVMATRGRLPPL